MNKEKDVIEGEVAVASEVAVDEQLLALRSASLSIARRNEACKTQFVFSWKGQPVTMWATEALKVLDELAQSRLDLLENYEEMKLDEAIAAIQDESCYECTYGCGDAAHCPASDCKLAKASRIAVRSMEAWKQLQKEVSDKDLTKEQILEIIEKCAPKGEKYNV